jgi:RhtB (resistance to homoserine/threonine) family protein
MELYAVLIGTVIAAHLLAVVSPGPDFFMVVRNSITYSRSTGIYTAIGLGIGIAVHVTYSLAGIALIISQSIILFSTIKYIGALYLIYIGIQSIRSKENTMNIQITKNVDTLNPINAIKMGFLTNVLNPKATMFFLSLFTIVISPETPTVVLIIICSALVVNTIAWFSIVAVIMSNTKVQNMYKQSQSVINTIFGALLMGLGIKIAFSK